MQREVQSKDSRWTEAVPKKVEAAEREGQNGNEERSKTVEVCPAQWVGMEHRENTSGGVFVAVDSNLGAVESPKHGVVYEKDRVSARCTSGPKKAGPRGMRPCLRQL